MKIAAGKESHYAEWKAKNEDSYGSCTFRYAERWAGIMEARMAEGATLEEIAKSTSHEANTEGVTGFMYGAAAAILAECWEHGEQLRRWHNLSVQIRNEGEQANREGGVLNPALVILSKKETP